MGSSQAPHESEPESESESAIYLEKKTKNKLGVGFRFCFQRNGSKIKNQEWDFVFSGTDQDVNNGCKGWSSYAKNWTFAVEAFDVMCSEYKLTL